MKRIVLVVALMLMLCCGGIQAQDATPTTPATYPLELPPGFTKSGTLLKLGDSTTLGFTVPAGLDMVIDVTADKVVVVSACVEIDGPPICPPGSGGGDGDFPVSRSIYVPSSDEAQTIDLSIQRPLDGEVHYQLTTYGVVAQGLGLDESRTVGSATEDTPYTSYLLKVNPGQPFVIQVEDTRANGDFLWVAHQPYINSFFTATETRQTFAQRIDAASRKDNPNGVERLELYYLGGDEFRVLVGAGGRFMLNSSTLKVQQFEPDTVLALTISYRTPLGVARLNTTEAGGAKVDFQIARGVEVLVGVYYQGNSMGDVLALGADNASGPRFQLAGTVHTVTGDRPVYAIIQLPDESTRAPFSVTMEWRKEG
ncbi:MAG: hypothetical protein ABI700_06360 [Chloroflexota bacterium]